MTSPDEFKNALARQPSLDALSKFKARNGHDTTKASNKAEQDDNSLTKESPAEGSVFSACQCASSSPCVIS